MAQIIPEMPMVEDLGYVQECLLCGGKGLPWPTLTQAQDAAVWHVYEKHPEDWRRLIGDRPPLNPDPRKA